MRVAIRSMGLEDIAEFDPDKKIVRKASDDEPFSALAFKILNDPFVGQLTFFRRVFNGKLDAEISAEGNVVATVQPGANSAS